MPKMKKLLQTKTALALFVATAALSFVICMPRITRADHIRTVPFQGCLLVAGSTPPSYNCPFEAGYDPNRGVMTAQLTTVYFDFTRTASDINVFASINKTSDTGSLYRD